MSIEKLHEQYGELMIQKEIIDNRVMEVKRAIANEMNKPKEEKKEVPSETAQG